jgi:hypothetical protein
MLLSSTGVMQFSPGNTVKMTLTTAGRLGVGTDAPLSGIDQAGSTATLASHIIRLANTTASESATLTLIHTRGTTTSPTLSSDGDELGRINFLGYTDTYTTSAWIRVTAGTGYGPTGSDAPGTLWLGVTPAASATPTDVVKITQDYLFSLQPTGTAFEMLGSAPSLGVSTAGSWRTRNNAGTAEVSWNNHPWQDFTTDHVGFGAHVGTKTDIRWLVAWGRDQPYLVDNGAGDAPRTTGGENIMGTIPALRPGVIRGLRVNSERAPGAGTFRFEVYASGAATGVTVTLSGASLSGSDTTNVYEVPMGNLMSTRLTFTGPPTVSPGQVWAEFIY